ncbi:MAG: hypothetical protein NTW52_09110 [Planctomycetota bacterium]|nr:hypothetical protein [Planctomycetota bacterium]
MSKKRPQQTMNLAAAGVISAAALVGGWGWFSHLQEDSKFEQPSESTSIKASRALNPSDITSKSKNELESNANSGSVASLDIWGRSLQHGFRAEASTTIVPPKPPIVEAVAPVIPPPPAINDLGLRLVGTVLEEGRSMAIAIDGSGTLDFRGEGDLLRLQPDGVRIDKVSKGSVLVSYQGKSSTWQMGQSLQFQTAASTGGQEPIPLTTATATENNSFDQPSPKMMPQQPDQPPSAMPTNTKALPKMSIDDELDMLNSPKPLDPF